MMAVLILAALLRLPALDHSPPGLTFDEASIGYDAWSLLLTGRDHQGNPWPVYLESFGDYKDPVNVYATMPLIAVVGLSTTSVRAVSALFGIAGVAATYLLARRLLGPREARVAALLLAVCPWHVHFSRFALEPILLPFWTALSLYFLMGKGRELVLAGPALTLGMYSYAVGKAFLPLLACAVLVFRRRELEGQKRYLMLGVLAAALLLAPLVRLHVTHPDRAGARIGMLSIASDEVVRLDMARFGTTSPLVATTFRFLRNYSLHILPSFLFFSGDPDPLNGLPGRGLLEPVTAVLALLGLGIALRERRWALVAWLIIFPVAGAATDIEVAQARRAIALLPLPHLLAAHALGVMRRRQGDNVALILACFLALSFATVQAERLVDYPARPDVALATGEPLRTALAAITPGTSLVIDSAMENAYAQVLFHRRVLPDRYLAGGWDGTGLSFERPPLPKGTMLLTPGGPFAVSIADMDVLGRTCGPPPDVFPFKVVTAPGRLNVSATLDLPDICREMGFELDRGTAGVLELKFVPVEGGTCERPCPGQYRSLISLRVPPGEYLVRASFGEIRLGERRVTVPPARPPGGTKVAFTLPDGSVGLWLVQS